MQNYRVVSNERIEGQPAKILFVSPFSCLYGGERSLLELITGLNRQRFAPTIVSGGEGPLLDELRAAQIPVKVLQMPYMTQRGREAFTFVCGVLPASLRLAQYVRQAQFDIVYNNIMQNPYGALAARFAGVPCVWHIRELPQNALVRTKMPLVVGLLADRIVAISQAVEAMFPHRISQQKVRLVYNGVAPDRFNPAHFDPAAARRNLSIQLSQPVIGIIGRIHPSKGHHDLLQAMLELRQQWPDCLLLVVGDGPSEHEQDVRFATRQLGLGENVRFLGRLEDVREVIAALDVLALPSYHEAFGRILIEAMAMEKPVVATDSGGPPDIVTPDTGLLVSTGAPKKMASAISFLLQNPERAAEMGRCGRERVLALFSFERTVRKIEDILTELLFEREK